MGDKVKKYDYPSDQAGGVRPLNIRGIFEEEKHRLSEEFTNEERKWRKQWLKDQYLSPNEPRPESIEWVKEVRNPIRRYLSYPWQKLENAMAPITGKNFAAHFRYGVPKIAIAIAFTYYSWYWLKYNQSDWTRAFGWSLTMPKPIAYPGDSNFPLERERFVPQDYNDRGFKSRKVFLDINRN